MNLTETRSGKQATTEKSIASSESGCTEISANNITVKRLVVDNLTTDMLTVK